MGNFSEATGELDANVNVISKSTGGTANFTLTAGVKNANLNYLLLGSISGTSPGFPLLGGAGCPRRRHGTAQHFRPDQHRIRRDDHVLRLCCEYEPLGFCIQPCGDRTRALMHQARARAWQKERDID